MEPFPQSLCHDCAHHHRVTAARSVFLMCKKLPSKYPPQPVLQCLAFEPAPGRGEDPPNRRQGE